MTSDDILNIFRTSLFPDVVVPAGFFVLCVLIAALTSLVLKRRRPGLAFLGAMLAAASVYEGTTFTAMPLWIFALMLGCGLLAGSKPEGARARR